MTGRWPSCEFWVCGLKLKWKRLPRRGSDGSRSYSSDALRGDIAPGSGELSWPDIYCSEPTVLNRRIDDESVLLNGCSGIMHSRNQCLAQLAQLLPESLKLSLPLELVWMSNFAPTWRMVNCYPETCYAIISTGLAVHVKGFGSASGNPCSGRPASL